MPISEGGSGSVRTDQHVQPLHRQIDPVRPERQEPGELQPVEQRLHRPGPRADAHLGEKLRRRLRVAVVPLGAGQGPRPLGARDGDETIPTLFLQLAAASRLHRHDRILATRLSSHQTATWTYG